MIRMKTGLWIIAFLAVCNFHINSPLSSYSQNDAYPVFSTLNPVDDGLLLRNEILSLIGDRPEWLKPNTWGFSISPFWQVAECARAPRIMGCDYLTCINTESATNNCNCTTQCVELGDLNGKWSLLPLLFGCKPQNAQCLYPTLEEARQEIFPDIPVGQPINYPELIDPNEQLGFISFPGQYRKRGVRFEIEAMLGCGFGLKLQTGIADMCLTLTSKNSCSPTEQCTCWEDFPNLTGNVNKYLVCKYRQIAKELCLDICNFHGCYIEDVWLRGFWRRAYELAENPDCPHYVLAIPYLEIGGIFATGKRKDPNEPFSLSFGNNGHHALGGTAGIDFNWPESIEFGGEAGLTYFFPRDVDCLRVPTSIYQSGIYPYATCAKVSPGLNCHIGAKIACYHFLGCLSFYFQYIYLSHKEDTIELKQCDPAFHPEVLECRSPWKVQMGNLGFNYDISENLVLGILWQIPLSQCNAYKTTSVLVSLSGLF